MCQGNANNLVKPMFCNNNIPTNPKIIEPKKPNNQNEVGKESFPSKKFINSLFIGGNFLKLIFNSDKFTFLPDPQVIKNKINTVAIGGTKNHVQKLDHSLDDILLP